MTVKLVHASGNGTKLSAPAANPSADITLKVPSTTGSAGQVLKVASANHSSTNAELEWGADTGGKILQVVQLLKTDTWSESSVAEGGFSGLISGFTQSFTCSATSSKVLIQGSLHVENPVGGGWGVGAIITADGSTITAATGNARGSNRSRLHAHMPTGYLGGPIQLQYLHSPSSTSAITYGVKLWNGHTSAQNLVLNYGSSSDSDVNNSFTCVSTIIFKEVSA